MNDAMNERNGDAGPRPAPQARGGRGARGGFTLVEMLIALVITGIMAGGVISLLMGQNDFYRSTDDGVFAEQSLRATSDLVASETRMVNPGRDVLAAGDDQLRFRFDAFRGVVCHVNGDDVWVYMYETVTAPNLSGGRGYAFGQPYKGSAWSEGAWNPMDGSEETAAADDANIDDTCAANGGPSGEELTDYYRWQPWNGSPVPEDGAVLRIFGEVEYTIAPSASGSGTAIFRNGQELAGPFGSDAAFSYVMESGAVESSTTDFANIDRVRINATALGGGSSPSGVERDLQFDIPLKN